MAILNRISKYMYCFYSEESSEFKRHYNSISKEGLFINDHGFLGDNGVVYNTHIFVLANIDKTFDFDTTLNFFRGYSYYEDDYSVKEGQHMIVFKLRKNFVQSLRHFRRSRYSKMYEREYIDRYFSGSSEFAIKYKGKPLTLKRAEELSENAPSLESAMDDTYISAYAVLTKAPILRKMLSIIYKIDLEKESELDSAIDPSKEIFRYSECIQQSLDKTADASLD